MTKCDREGRLNMTAVMIVMHARCILTKLGAPLAHSEAEIERANVEIRLRIAQLGHSLMYI